MQFPQKRKLICVMLTSALFSSASFAADDDVKLSDIEVVGTTPLHGVGLPKDQVAANVQTATEEDIERVQSLDISDFMNKTLGSVSLNQAQNNPFQPDLQFRGFTASPLVGNSQGLSVYIDGIRVNEPFGDAVNFDLIPQSAIASTNLIPGSNPLFGLNTLGGALSLKTKTGFTNPGHSLEAYTGSFGRDSGTIESGGSDGNFAYFVTGSITKEDGWRDFSPSRVEQFFTNLSYADEDSTLDFGITAVDSDLNGNGASPTLLVDADREAVFTHPDNTQNKLRMFTLNGTHWINDNTMLAANTYYRKSDRTSFNGDGSEFSVIGGQIGEDEDGVEGVFDGDDEVLPVSAAALGFADGDFVALNNTSKTEQDSYGFAFQSTFLQDLFGRDNQLIVGVGYDRSDVDYSSQSEIAQFTNTRGTSGTGYVIEDTLVDGKIKTDTYSIFFTNTHSFTDRLAMTVGARYNWIEVDISGYSEGGEQDLNESGNSHTFKRLNPSLGLTYKLTDNMTSYVSYNESNRAPTATELTCAEPESPCAYPNAFLADPPLDDVVARTIETGLRGQQELFDWYANVYYTELKDDLLFFSEDESQSEDVSGRLGLGNFRNIDKTARAGLELGMAGQYEKLSWSANYGYVRATFEDNFTYSRDGDLYNVSKGDRLPSIPAHNLKVGLDYAFTQQFSAGLTASYHSSQRYRGDEANVDKKIAGYRIVNLHSRYKVNEHLQFFAKVDNLFDSEYNTFGLYGEPDEAPGMDAYEGDERFVGTSSPRAGWIGFKLTM
ncbi:MULTISPECIES: TonB-dependent receptor [Methylophaga]|jgi:outer membrane receptor protein involved in Fe transport|uniref:TonB-dependent receptor n=1 Tax=Methylophaga marina TaxID=45495 RepID=A0ABP3D3A8_9GAMM|nr:MULTISPECIES: TonB-dependent receptor [Methylophaga]BDZ72700.1 membrane protein [Methylophaga marina]|tara:strand:- start:732 stop:3056 length:2325 start_codon:yes stop_codon:yes gene_type:complete